jgi:hypothetical protein
MREAMNAIDRIVQEVERKVRLVDEKLEGFFRTHTVRPGTFRPAVDELRSVPNRLSDMATEGSCAMRYAFAYFLKATAILQFLVGAGMAIGGASNNWEGSMLTIGLGIMVFAQFVWMGGRMVHRSADRKRYAQFQNRLLRLARQKGGRLTVLEAATDGRMTVEQAEELLRELVARGHAELRISESRMMVYMFLEIERDSEKDDARPIDEL